MSLPLEAVAPTPDFTALKTRQQAAWAAGDYSAIGVTLQIVAEQLCESIDLGAGEGVLDVAAGNGAASLAAARRNAVVTATDYVPDLLERARERAAADRLEMTFQTADAENLPFRSGTFDVVLSTFGVMFTPDQERAAGEMLRVCRKGGRIGLASWTPDGFIGQLFKTLGARLPPPPGLRSPMLWGTRGHLDHLFASCSRIRGVERDFVFRYRSPQEWWSRFSRLYGPLCKALEALPPEGRVQLEHDVLGLIDKFRDRTAGTGLRLPSRYLEVVIEV